MPDTLFELTAECNRLISAMEEVEAMELPEDQRQVAAATLEDAFWKSQSAFADKVEAYVKVSETMRVRAEARGAEAKRLADLAKSEEGERKRLLQRLQDRMSEAGYTPGGLKLQTPRYKVGIVTNGGKRHLRIEDEDGFRALAPDMFTEVTTVAFVPETDMIRATIEAWEATPEAERGTHPFGEYANLLPRGTRLAIR